MTRRVLVTAGASGIGREIVRAFAADGLRLKDVGLLRGELGSLPAAGLNDEVERAILQARALLGSNTAKG